jgi:integrase/recombinase XerD
MAIRVVPAGAGEPSASNSSDLVRLVRAAYLARFKGDSRQHTGSDLNGFLTWCREREVSG